MDNICCQNNGCMEKANSLADLTRDNRVRLAEKAILCLVRDIADNKGGIEIEDLLTQVEQILDLDEFVSPEFGEIGNVKRFIRYTIYRMIDEKKLLWVFGLHPETDCFLTTS